MIISVTEEEVLELIIEGIQRRFEGYDVVGDTINCYGESAFKLIKKEIKDENLSK